MEVGKSRNTIRGPRNAMKAAIYARYSTDMQRAESITGQVRICRERAKREGWEVVKVYSDEQISGHDEDRAGYRALLADIDARLIDIIIVEDTSRLWRNQTEQNIFKDEYIEYHGVNIVSINRSEEHTSELQSH